jgi:hypothetical protein
MKCIIGVISSPGDAYSVMKNIWIQNVSLFNSSQSSHSINLYFLEGIQRHDTQLFSISKIDNNINNFYCNCEEKFENILKKSIIFFKYLTNNYNTIENNEYTFFIRSNLSTLFHFPKLFAQLQNINQILHLENNDKFLGGSFISKFFGIFSRFSGTNLTYTLPCIKLIVENYKAVLTFFKADDVCLSGWLVKHFFEELIYLDFPRLDFCKKIVFNSTDLYDNNIFCFRFKSENRELDSLFMRTFLEQMYSPDFNISEFISSFTQLSSLEITTHNKEYINIYAKRAFKITNDIDDVTSNSTKK